MSMLFNGLSAFPITPVTKNGFDERAFTTLITRLTEAGVDSIGAEGSTGSYPYLNRHERARVAELAVQNAGSTPVLVSIGALRLRDILTYAEDAQKAGVKALLLPTMSYVPLRDDEVFALYDTVSRAVSVPIIIYDTPGTTQFRFSDELVQRIAALPNIRSIKVPSAFPTANDAIARLHRLAQIAPDTLTLGVSGDPTAADGLMNGAKLWYSEWGGLFPHLARRLTDAALANEHATVEAVSAIFRPFWNMSERYGGSLRVISSTASLMGLAPEPCLPTPLHGVSADDRTALAELIRTHNPA